MKENPDYILKPDIYKEWYFQSDYGLETAEAMFKTGRYIYCVFMCHLCLEKVLKGLLVKRKNEFPTKLHNLIYFIDKIGIELKKDDLEFELQTFVDAAFGTAHAAA